MIKYIFSGFTSILKILEKTNTILILWAKYQHWFYETGQSSVKTSILLLQRNEFDKLEKAKEIMYLGLNKSLILFSKYLIRGW